MGLLCSFLKVMSVILNLFPSLLIFDICHLLTLVNVPFLIFSPIVEGCPDATERPVDIARQLVEENLDINVALGGGLRNFVPKSKGGQRLDGRDLTQEWLNNQTTLGRRAKLMTNPKNFMKTDFSKVDYLLGELRGSVVSRDGKYLLMKVES